MTSESQLATWRRQPLREQEKLADVQRKIARSQAKIARAESRR